MNQAATSQENTSEQIRIDAEKHVETTYVFSFSRPIDLSDIAGTQKMFSATSMKIRHETDDDGEFYTEVNFRAQPYNSSGTTLDRRAKNTSNTSGYPSESDYASIQAVVKEQVSPDHWETIESTMRSRIDVKEAKQQLINQYSGDA